MDISTTIKYIAAGLFVFYLIFNFFRKKDVNNKPIVGWFDMAFFIILYAAILVSFVIASDWPMVVIFATFVVWGIQGAIASKKSVKKKHTRVSRSPRVSLAKQKPGAEAQQSRKK